MEKKFYRHRIENLVAVERIVTVHYLEYPKNYAFDGESHDFWEMVYVDKGSVVCSRDSGEEFSLSRGNFILHKPNEFHTIRADGISDANVFVVSFQARSEALGYLSDKIITPDTRGRTLLGEIMEDAENTFDLPVFDPSLVKLKLKEKPALGGLQMLKINLEKLLILSLRQKDTGSEKVFIHPKSYKDGLEKAVTEFLSANVYKKLTLDDICREFNYGKTYISVEFKKRTGVTVFKYLQSLKIDEAKRLIRENKYTFGEISSLLCFESYSYFVKVFKKYTNTLPGEYARLIRAT